MKVLEIITEESSIIDPATGKPFEAPPPKTPKTPKAPKSRSKIPTPQSLIDSAKRRVKTRVKYLRNAEKVVDAKYGGWMKMAFRGLGLTVAITETWAITSALDDMYQEGEMSREGLEEGREFAWGLFNTAMIAPAVVKLTSRALLVTTVLRLFKNALAVIAAPVSLGASVVGAVATEAFFVWLRKWIMSPEGQEFFKTYLFEVVRYFGKPTDATANLLQKAWRTVQGKEGDYYQDAEKRKEQSGKDDKGQGAQTDKEPQVTASSETWPRHVRFTHQNRIYVGGKIVTDHTATLIPGVQNEIRVQGARATAKLLKLKDPLEDIPVKPGQEPIKPI
jgi:hypothetical protein